MHQLKAKIVRLGKKARLETSNFSSVKCLKVITPILTTKKKKSEQSENQCLLLDPSEN